MKLLVLIIVSCMVKLCLAQPPKSFYTRFGGNGYDVGYDVKQTFDNGYIITGSTSSFGQGNTDLYLVKLDSVGQKVFQKAFGNYNNEVGRSIVQLLDSGFVMAGYTNSNGFGGYDFFVAKTDKNGNTLWEKTYGGSDWDFAYSLEATNDGGFIIAGTTYSFGRGNADGYVIKLNQNGIEEWSKTFGGLNDDEFKSVIQTSDGGYALTGYTKSYLDTDSGDVWVFKLTNLGDSAWCKFYGGTKEDFGSQVIELQNQRILVSGGTKSFSLNHNFETIILDYHSLNGILNYSYVDVSTSDEYYNGIAQAINGNIAGAGVTTNPDFGKDGIIDIYNSIYNYVNFFSEGSIGEDEFFSITSTKDKGFVAVGKTNGYNSILEDVFLLKVDSLGNKGSNITTTRENIKDLQVYFYPNPFSSSIDIIIPDNIELGFIEIIDLQSRILIKEFLNNSTVNYKINTEHLNKGLYFLKISDKSGKYYFTQKIVKIN